MRPELQRRVQRYGWDYSSPHYEEGWQHQLWPAQERLLRAANLKAGEKVLDISCGTGLVTFPIAEAVGAAGQVTGIDLSEEMIKKAAPIADKKGLSHVSFKHMDAEELDLPDGAFDAAINSLGLMYYPDPDKAVQEMHRVLKPGGRSAALVWGRRGACGWAEIFPIVDRRVNTDVCPLFFQLGTGETLQKTFEKAGFTEIKSERFNIDLHYDTDREAIIGAFLGGAVALAYRKFDEKTKDEAHGEYLDSIAQFRNENGYDIPGEFVITSGVKNEKL
ncbi:class I SAM-dependent methyltransferase [Aliifodinibius sp. S!AR15-10]|uniref:class I SAM-dependent methyltransferase n=1 Tax=Aliifodinibius sp. S!AR15-10 TaxID=2950437 RepID=UPI00286427C9|nr:class I SAM-dependent methyltransferase [Aliifodinibius sp. S!AR15-10]MDR8393292.1 class I SAM-dependent methyltransferase [Aliifodinibius sp. S!AR15-10]